MDKNFRLSFPNELSSKLISLKNVQTQEVENLATDLMKWEEFRGLCLSKE